MEIDTAVMHAAERASELPSDNLLPQDISEIPSDEHIADTVLGATKDAIHSEDHLCKVTEHFLEDGTFATALETIIDERIKTTPNPGPIPN